MVDADVVPLASVLDTSNLEEHEQIFVSKIYLATDVKDALKVSRIVSRPCDENRDLIDEVNSNETWGRICSLMGEMEYHMMWKLKFVMYELTSNIKISLNGRLMLEVTPPSIGKKKQNEGAPVIDLSKGYNRRSLIDRNFRIDRGMLCGRNIMPTNYESVCTLIQNQKTGIPCGSFCDYITYKQSILLRKFLRQKFSLEFFRKKFNTNNPQKNSSSFSIVQINAFVKSILVSHVPRDLIGSKKTFDKMTRNICQVFSTNHRYPLRLGTLMKGLPSLGFHGNVFLSKFVLFLFNVFVSRVVSRLFYRIESLKDRKVIFFKKRVWAKYEANAVEKMVDSGILTQSSEVSYGPLVSKLRILPKTNGFRPLVKSSTSIKRMRFRLSVCNTFLKQVVNQINPSYFNCLDALHAQWGNIKPSKSDKLYFIRTDVSDAFQSIYHMKLLEILNRRLSALDPVQTCRTFEYRCGLRKKTILQFTKIMPRLSKKTLFCEAGKKVYTTSYLKALIIQYIKQNYVSLDGTKVFRQTQGIPQGCYLSSVLCELYLTDMDDCYFNHLKGENDVFIRGMDDYLYLTYDSQKAKTFLNLIYNGPVVDYGISFQLAKTVTNLEGPETIFSFYGYIFYPRFRKVEPDFSEWDGDITRRMNLNPGMTWCDLSKRMKMITHIKLHKLIVDSDYLHKFAVMKNIYLCAKIHAAKYKAIYDFLTENVGGSPPSTAECLKPIILAARVIANKVVSINDGNSALSHREVKIVVLKGFEAVLGPTGGPFRNLVNLLRVTIRRMLQNKILSTRFKKLLKSLIKYN